MSDVQDVELVRGQRHLRVPQRHATTCDVQPQVAVGVGFVGVGGRGRSRRGCACCVRRACRVHRTRRTCRARCTGCARRALRAGAPQHRVDARRHLVGVERLGHVVVGPPLEHVHLVRGGRLRRHHDDGRPHAASRAPAPRNPGPSMPGSIMSSRTRSNAARSTCRRASVPENAGTAWNPSRATIFASSALMSGSSSTTRMVPAPTFAPSPSAPFAPASPSPPSCP